MAKHAATTTRRLFSSNVMILLVSLFIASVIWMISKLDEVEVETISVHIDLIEKPVNCEVEVIPEWIDVRVQYQKGYKDKVTPDNIRVNLRLFYDDSIGDVNDYKATPRTITPQNVKVTEAADFIRVVEIIGDGTVNVRARKYTELARVRADIRGEPAPEYRMGDITIEPQHVRLTGPPDKLEELKQEFNGDILLDTEPVDIAGAQQNVFDIRGLILFPDVKLANPDGGQIEINIQIVEKTGRKEIPGVNVVYRPFENNLIARCDPSSATVSVEAPLSTLEKLNPGDFTVKPKQFIAEEVGAKGSVAVEATFADSVELTLREKITILSVTPNVVGVEISRP